MAKCGYVRANAKKMKQIIFITSILFLVVACGKTKPVTKPKEEVKVDSLEILRPSFQVYGFPDQTDRQRQIVDDWYGFRFQILAGCLVTDSLTRSVKRHNEITDSVMTIRKGKDWMTRFEKSVDSLFTIDSTAIEIARSDKFVKNFEVNTEKHNDEYNYYPNLTYYVHFTPIENQKLVSLEGYGVIYKKVRHINYLRITVDMANRKVLNIEKTAYGD